MSMSMVKHEFPNIHFWKNWLKDSATVFSPSSFMSLTNIVFLTLLYNDENQQSCLFITVGFGLSSTIHTLLSWYIVISKHNMHVSSPIMILKIIQCPPSSNFSFFFLLILTCFTLWSSIKLWGTQWYIIFLYAVLDE